MFSRKSYLTAVVAFLIMISLDISGCGKQNIDNGSGQTPSVRTKAILLNGAGASFPYPLYSRWIDEYGRIEKNVKINYQSMGSGAGIEQISKKTIDFGGSDAPVDDDKLREFPGEILHIPTVLGSVAITYNLHKLKQKIKFNPDILTDIYLGKIKNWSDQRLVAINPGVNLPNQEIVVVHRSDGSGTTNIFTDYLCSVSPEWKLQVGKGTSVQWPIGVGAKGSEGLSHQVQSIAGSIGYVELSYALLNKLTYGMVQNSNGRFVSPTLESTTAAGAGAVASNMPDDLQVSIVNVPGESAYPIAGYTYILVYREQDDPVKGEALVKFLWWATHEGEKIATELAYAPLPPEVVDKVETKLESISNRGKKLFYKPTIRRDFL